MRMGNEQNVSLLSWGGLKLEFKSYTKGIDHPATPDQKLQADKIAEETLRKEERHFREQQIEDLTIVNPLALEEMIAQDLVEDLPDAQNSTE